MSRLVKLSFRDTVNNTNLKCKQGGEGADQAGRGWFYTLSQRETPTFTKERRHFSEFDHL